MDGAIVTPTTDAYSCGAFIQTKDGPEGDTYVKDSYGFLSYKDTISPDLMAKFQKSIAAFINRATGQDLGEFEAVDPAVMKIPGSETYHFIQDFHQLYANHTYEAVYEIFTRVEGDVTNSYFIGYTRLAGRPAYYGKFRDWALK